MDTRLLRARLNLNSQYRRENGEGLIFFNRNSLQIFNNFYQRRNLIGTLIFEQLRSRGYNLTSRRTLELFSNIYDSIGINYNTSVLDNNTSLLRNNHSNNLITEFDDYSIVLDNGDLNISSLENIIGTQRDYTISHDINPGMFRNFVLLNPRNNYERNMMRELLNSNHSCIVGYYGDEADLDRENHRTDANILESNTSGHIIPNVDVDNGYAYILTNMR